MALIDRAARTLTDQLPKVISPRNHAIIDYVTAGSFFLMGALFWKRNRRAALAAIVCGVAEAGTAMFTDYPGGVEKVISFQTHGEIDAGLAAVVAMMPNVMAFSDDPEAKHFRIQALAIGAVTGMTDFEAPVGSNAGECAA